MTLRDIGCRECQLVSSGDCGRHGPVTFHMGAILNTHYAAPNRHEKWGPSPLCQKGEHEWCANRTPEECHCGCECHVKVTLPASPALGAPDIPAPTSKEKRAFMEGWRHGYYDGGEHDCRMFKPTAERAWQDYLSERRK
jgi:hypothetical protein